MTDLSLHDWAQYKSRLVGFPNGDGKLLVRVSPSALVNYVAFLKFIRCSLL